MSRSNRAIGILICIWLVGAIILNAVMLIHNIQTRDWLWVAIEVPLVLAGTWWAVYYAAYLRNNR